MFWKTAILGILTATALLSTPVGALATDEHTTPPPCVEVSTDPPDVTIDPSCFPEPKKSPAPLPLLSRAAF